MILISFNELDEIFSNLNNNEDLNYHEILAEIQSIFPELSAQLQNDINSEFVKNDNMLSQCKLLHSAAENGYTNIVKALLIHPRIDVNGLYEDNSTPLHLAARGGHLGVVKDLLEHPGIEVNVRNSRPIYLCRTQDDGTPLHVAAFRGNIDVVQALLAHPKIDVNARNEDDNDTPLHFAALGSRVDLIQALLAHPGIKVNVQNRIKVTPLHSAARKGHVDIVQALLVHPEIEVNVRNGYKGTPLYDAAALGHVDVVQALLAHPEIEVTLRSEDGNTPLHAAAGQGHVDVVKALLAYPKDDSPILFAARGHLDIVKALLEIEVNAQNEDNMTPLHDASKNGRTNVVKTLLAHPKIDVNARDAMDDTPLHDAARRGHIDVVKALLASPEIEVNAQNEDNMTPLHLAARRGHLEVGNLLIKNILFRNFNTEKPNFLNNNAELSNYWDQRKAEITTMSTYVIGNMRNRNISLNDFLTETDDVKLVSYMQGGRIVLRDALHNLQYPPQLVNLRSNNYTEGAETRILDVFPIFADLLENRIQSRITEGERKKCLYNGVGKLKFKQLPPELMNIVNENLGNDHKSRLNLSLACPPSRVEQPNVEPALPNNLRV